MTATLTATARLLAGAELAATLRVCWAGDAPLLATYHRRAPCTLDEAVADTCRLLREGGSEVYALETQNRELVGVIGFQEQRRLLTTFGLAVRYRTPEGKAMFWDALNELTGGELVLVGLYLRNHRASSFLVREGGATIEDTQTCPETGEPTIIYAL